MLERTPAAARQLASRARRRVRGAAPAPDPDIARQRAVVDAFFTAARAGEFDALVGLLHPDVVLRADGGTKLARQTVTIRGAAAVARQAKGFATFDPVFQPTLVNGAAGIVLLAGGRTLSVMGVTVTDDRIVAIDVLLDPDRVRDLDLTMLGDPL
jgi:RNA polymerase sigma-70 factor (ECF subfamily)